MSSNQLSGARFLAESLKRCGVRDVFFIDAILRRSLIEMEQVGIGRVLVHSEKTAAYMADGYARVSGRIGVCMAQSVGAANLAAGLQDAYLHRSPVIALTGRKPPMYRYRNAYQEIEHAPLYAPVTKMHADVDQVEQLPLLLEQAMREATTGTPRPAHLDFNGLQGELIEAAQLTDPAFPDPRYGRLAVRRSAPDSDELERAARLLAKAEKPVLLCGTGAIQAGAQDQVLAFINAFDIPVASSLGGRGIVPTVHPRYFGVAGTYSAAITNQLLHEADLVLFAGCHTGDQVTNNWTVPAPGTAIIQIDIDSREIGRNYPNVTGIEGDPKTVLGSLSEALRRRPEWTAWADAVASRFAEWRTAMSAICQSNDKLLRVERLCHELGEWLPPDAVLVADTGYSGIWTGTLVELKHAGQQYLRAAGSLGWSFPASLGAKCAVPERPVICFSGDGAAYYHLTELETAKRRGIAVILVINNNSAFAQGLPNLRNIYGDTPGNAEEMLCFGPTNFADVARAFGVTGIRVEHPQLLRPALDRALELGGPVVIDAVTNAENRAPAAWTPPA